LGYHFFNLALVFPNSQTECRKDFSSQTRHLSGTLEVLLESTHELLLLGRGLVSTVTECGRCRDELEVDLLSGAAGGVNEHGLAESDNALLDSGNTSLEHDEVVLDFTVTNEATHGGDGLLGNVKLGRGVASIVTTANTVDLVVDRGTVVVTHLTSTGNGPLD
jgi:hypothetical protein